MVWLDDDRRCSLNFSFSDVDGGKFRSTESRGDFEGGVDADDVVRSLEEPL